MSDEENIFDDTEITSDDKYIYLIHGNWFELKSLNHKLTHPYDSEAFKKEIISQVNDRAEKLDFIDIHFMSKYKNYQIEEIKFYLDQHKFNTMIDMLLPEKRHPIITFHGTTSYEIVISIIENGYIIPKSKGNIKKVHGSAYGEGVYSSPHAEKALYYTNIDNHKNVYLLINFVFLGVAKLIPSGITNLPQFVDNIYTDGTQTRIVHGLEQLVSADPSRVVPIGYIKIKI